MAFLDRRGVLGGLAAISAGPALAQDKSPASPVAHGILAENSIALGFETPPQDKLPDVSVWGPQGLRNIAELTNRTILMPLWAEWCAPCLSELPDFARLQRKYGNDKFAIIPVLTATQKRITPELLALLLRAAHADIFEPLIENHLGQRLAVQMGRGKVESYALPCNLLIAPGGRVIGREMGRINNAEGAEPAKTYKETLSRVDANAVQSRWGEADGEAFAAAMANGFLA